jgi:hypothetical protein
VGDLEELDDEAITELLGSRGGGRGGVGAGNEGDEEGSGEEVEEVEEAAGQKNKSAGKVKGGGEGGREEEAAAAGEVVGGSGDSSESEEGGDGGSATRQAIAALDRRLHLAKQLGLLPEELVFKAAPGGLMGWGRGCGGCVWGGAAPAGG